MVNGLIPFVFGPRCRAHYKSNAEKPNEVFMKNICFLFLTLFFVSCTNDGGTSGQGQQVKNKNDMKEGKVASAADLRRAIASQTAEKKDFSKVFGTSTINSDRSNIVWNCDREALPRTCCYYLLTNGGGVYGSPSCVEENH